MINLKLYRERPTFVTGGCGIHGNNDLTRLARHDS